MDRTNAMRAAPLALLLAACGNAEVGLPRQVAVEWPQGQRLYVGDERQGVVKAFSIFDGPRAVGESRVPGRGRVLDIKVDGRRRRIWVLGPQAVDEHDAVSLALLRRHPAAGVTSASRLRLDERGVATVVASDPGAER